jgi:hypothetical protein
MKVNNTKSKKGKIMGNPTKHTKEGFIRFLKENGITNGVLERIEVLPDIIHLDSDYKLNIVTTLQNKGTSYYEFELNYYSEEFMEFLLPYTIKDNVEVSVNILECELLKRDLIEIEDNSDD